jgi:hypothetical protein
MHKALTKDALGWGFVLWLVGYLLGLALFFAVPTALIGWVIAPIGVALTVWVALTRIPAHGLPQWFVIALVWTVLAIALDYLLIVRAFHPADGYYKADVYVYYAATFIIPLAIGWWRGTAPRRLTA